MKSPVERYVGKNIMFSQLNDAKIVSTYYRSEHNLLNIPILYLT